MIFNAQKETLRDRERGETQRDTDRQTERHTETIEKLTGYLTSR